jgi:hypothetical protein
MNMLGVPKYTVNSLDKFQARWVAELPSML